jgi:hypothetical protein
LKAHSSIGIHYWEKYFILKLLPVPGQWVHVDIDNGTRDYLVMSELRNYKHIEALETATGIESIASTAMGIKFYKYLTGIGFGSVQTEAKGIELIKELKKL